MSYLYDLFFFVCVQYLRQPTQHQAQRLFPLLRTLPSPRGNSLTMWTSGSLVDYCWEDARCWRSSASCCSSSIDARRQALAPHAPLAPPAPPAPPPPTTLSTTRTTIQRCPKVPPAAVVWCNLCRHRRQEIVKTTTPQHKTIRILSLFLL